MTSQSSITEGLRRLTEVRSTINSAPVYEETEVAEGIVDLRSAQQIAICVGESCLSTTVMYSRRERVTYDQGLPLGALALGVERPTVVPERCPEHPSKFALKTERPVSFPVYGDKITGNVPLRGW